jgi:uncharacterized protein (UPF0332 family)
MPTYDADLFDAAERLLRRPNERGRLSRARVRRSVSTVYYTLFHFLLEEIARRIVGTHNDLLERRRILMRTITHKGIKTTLEKVRGNAIHESVAGYLKPVGAAAGQARPPAFIRSFANAFIDAQDKRHEADYDLNETPDEEDARVLADRVKNAIDAWRAATGDADRDFKHALCVLMLLKGQLRSEL